LYFLHCFGTYIVGWQERHQIQKNRGKRKRRENCLSRFTRKFKRPWKEAGCTVSVRRLSSTKHNNVYQVLSYEAVAILGLLRGAVSDWLVWWADCPSWSCERVSQRELVPVCERGQLPRAPYSQNPADTRHHAIILSSPPAPSAALLAVLILYESALKTWRIASLF